MSGSTGPLHLRAILLAAILACAALTACGGEPKPDPAKASFDLTIGNLVPLRGDLAEFGPAGREAAELAGRQANAAAGKAGAKISVEAATADSETQGQAALIGARKLIADRGATCLVGDWASTGTVAVANQIAAKDGVPLISPASTNFGITSLDDRGYAFRTAPSNHLQVIALADLVEQSIGDAGGRTVSLAGRKDGYGTELTGQFSREWRRRGGTIEGPTLYDPTQLRFTKEAGRIVAGEPDAFVIADFPETYARLADSLLRTGGFDPSKAFLPDTLIVDSAAQWEIPAAALDSARVTRPGASSDGAAGRAFQSLLQSEGKESEPEAFAAQAFDANILCFLAAVAAGSADSGAIKDEIAAVSGPPGAKLDFRRLDEAVRLLRQGREVDYQGASGPLDLDENGDPVSSTFDVLTYSGGAPRLTGRVDAG